MENKPDIKVRALYTKSLGKHLRTKEAYKNEANEKAYSDVEKKHGKEMREKLRSFHEANEKESMKSGGSTKHKTCEMSTHDANPKHKHCW
jgi:hypothetical protein